MTGIAVSGRRGWVRIIAWFAALILLPGCAQIPTTGPVEAGDARGHVPDAAVEIAPEGPVRGANPRTIVDGFLQAMANYQQGYQVAREYLAPEVRDVWRPDEGVAIYADGYGVSATLDSAVLEAPQVARVGPDGAYEHHHVPMRLDFGMVRDQDGEWRISQPPRGLLVSQYLFAKFYQRVNTYFFDPNYTMLVPDPIYLPRGNRTATPLLQALLRGPTEWLRPVVLSAIPPQTKLSLQAASVDARGVVEVSLNDAVVGLGEEQRGRMVGQITWTLGQLAGVTGVRLTVNGAPYPTREQNPQGIVPVSVSTFLDPISTQQNLQLFGVTAEGVVRLNETPRGAELVPVPGPLGRMRGIASVAPSLTGDQVAVVNDNRTQVTVGPLSDNQPRRVFEGSGILRPQFARSKESELWLVDDDGDHQAFRLVAQDGRVTRVGSPAFDGARIVAFRLAPEGVRMAAIVERAGRTELGLARINRSVDEIVVEEWRPVPLGDEVATPAPSRLVDVGWADATTLMVLAAEDAKKPVKPYKLDVNAADIAELGQSDNWQAETLATSPRPRAVRAVIVGRTGSWRYEDEYRWPVLAQGLAAAAFPG